MHTLCLIENLTNEHSIKWIPFSYLFSNLQLQVLQSCCISEGCVKRLFAISLYKTAKHEIFPTKSCLIMLDLFLNLL